MAAQWPPRGLKPWDDALKEYVDEIRSDLEPDVTDNTAARHTHANKELLDGIPTGGAWYQTLRRGTAGPEWVDPAGTVVPTMLVPMQGTLDGWDRSGAITGVGIGALRFRDGGALVEEAGANLVVNPVLRGTGLDQLNPVRSTVTRDTGTIVNGHPSLHVEILETSQFGSGVDFLSMTIPSLAVSMDIYNPGVSGINIEGQNVPAGATSRIRYVQSPDPNSRIRVRIYPSLVGDEWWMTRMQVEDRPYATSPIPEFEADGTTLKPGYAWTGTAHASASTRAETSITIPAASFPASLAIRYSEDMGQTWKLATLDDEGAFGNYGVVTYANGDLTFGVSERNVIIGGVRGDERALTDGEKASLLASPVWTWGGLAEGQQGPYTHPATILGAFPPNAQAAVGGATLRTAPGTTAPTIDTLTEGTEVHDTGQRITESATDYAYVLTAVGQGYVDESDITGL